VSDDEDDEDYDGQELDTELYASNLDDVDEVIMFRDAFFGLQSSNPDQY
jgi:hypothetical protein